MFSLRHSLFAGLLLTGVLALTGCSRDSANPLSPGASASNGMRPSEATIERMEAERDADPSLHFLFNFLKPRVMVVHASPDAPAVDVFVDNAKVLSEVPFPVNSPYLRVPAGTRNFKVKAANTDLTVIDATARLDWGRAYSVFAVNRLANIEPLVLNDDLRRPSPGKAKLRFVHLSPNAPAVDVALQGGAVLIPNKAFKEYTPFVELAAGTYDLEVRVAGTSDVALPLPGVKLQDGFIYTVWAKGLLGGTGDQALGAQVIVNRKPLFSRSASPVAVGR